MNFREKWRATVEKKSSTLCLNLDAAETGQRPQQTIGNQDKLSWAKELIRATEHAIAAIKPNRQYYKDFSRSQTQELNEFAHSFGLLSIDDSKIADIGSTNDAALYHAAIEGFDAVTYAPFPGNIADTCAMAQKRNLGLIPLALMSNPEYQLIKNLQIDGIAAFLYFARESSRAGAAGIVVGAPSPKNHISVDDLRQIKELITDDMTVLVPGIGAQGGDTAEVFDVFGKSAILSIGRDVVYAENPRERIDAYQRLIPLN